MGNYIYLGRVYVPAAGTTNLYNFEGNGYDLVGGATASLIGSLTFPGVPGAYHGNTWIQSGAPSLTGSVGYVTFPSANTNTSQGTLEFAFCTGLDVIDAQIPVMCTNSAAVNVLGWGMFSQQLTCILNGSTVFYVGSLLPIQPNSKYYVAITWGPGGTSWYGGAIGANNSVSPILLYNTPTAPSWGTTSYFYMFQSFNLLSNFIGSIDWVRFSNIQRTSFPTVDALLTPQPQLLFMGQDLTANVAQWDQIEQVKDVLLADATFVSSELNLTINNSSHFLSAEHPASMVQGRNWYNQSLQILIDGVVQFNGQVRDLQESPDDLTVTIVADDLMGSLTNAIVVASQTTTAGVNPGNAMVTILLDAGLEEYINQASFIDAGGPALAAGATIQYTFDSGSNTTALAAVQAIASLASISVFVYNNQIIARAFESYQGNGSGLRFPITDRIVRTWTEFDWDDESFNNQVAVTYVLGTGTSTVTATNNQSVAQNQVTRAYQFDGSNVIAASQSSAQYFANTYLARASNRRGILQFTGGQEFAHSVLGDRHWVTSVSMGLSSFPMEIIEIHRHLDTQDIDVTMVGLLNSNEAQSILFQENWLEYIPGPSIANLPGWASFDTSPGLTGIGVIGYNLALGGQVATLTPANGYNYGLLYLGRTFSDLDFKLKVDIGTAAGAVFWVLMRVQPGATYPTMNAYYVDMTPSGLFQIGQFVGGFRSVAASVNSVVFNPQNFNLEIIVQSLTINVLVNGASILTYNYAGSSNALYSGSIGFTGLGSTGYNYDVANIVMSQPK